MTKPKFAIASSSVVAKQGHLSAQWYVNQEQDRSPYIRTDDAKLRNAYPGEWSKPTCLWLNPADKKKVQKQLLAIRKAEAELKKMNLKLRNILINEE